MDDDHEHLLIIFLVTSNCKNQSYQTFLKGKSICCFFVASENLLFKSDNRKLLKNKCAYLKEDQINFHRQILKNKIHPFGFEKTADFVRFKRLNFRAFGFQSALCWIRIALSSRQTHVITMVQEVTFSK
jgi:hypothetical protein